ncbi:MAG TPA: HD domain-containing protein [Polyangiales bacterium]
MSTLERAICIAADAHAGQADKAGAPYILHVLRVMMKMSTAEERIVAMLHDVVEDTSWTLDRLAEEGFSKSVTEAIDGVTRRADEAYDAFIERAAQNPLSRRVKIADLEDNADLSRLAQPSQRDVERAEKYQRALERLKT